MPNNIYAENNNTVVQVVELKDNKELREAFKAAFPGVSFKPEPARWVMAQTVASVEGVTKFFNDKSIPLSGSNTPTSGDTLINKVWEHGGSAFVRVAELKDNEAIRKAFKHAFAGTKFVSKNLHWEVPNAKESTINDIKVFFSSHSIDLGSGSGDLPNPQIPKVEISEEIIFTKEVAAKLGTIFDRLAKGQEVLIKVQ